MRHGEAAFKEDDPKRGLTHDGKLAIERLAKSLQNKSSHQTSGQQINIEQVFHSDKARAQQTAKIMTSILAPGVTPLCRPGLRPNDNPENLLTDIDSWTKETLITSHLPFIPALLNLLIDQPQSISFYPGTIVCLNKADSNWHVEWVASPE
jgi:phosphohistidine phosphatase SixA